MVLQRRIRETLAQDPTRAARVPPPLPRPRPPQKRGPLTVREAVLLDGIDDPVPPARKKTKYEAAYDASREDADSNGYGCPLCHHLPQYQKGPLKPDTEASLRAHFAFAHGGGQLYVNGEEWMCPIWSCGIRCEGYSQFHRHCMEMHYGEAAPLKCPNCAPTSIVRYRGRGDLDAHRELRHPIIYRAEQERQRHRTLRISRAEILRLATATPKEWDRRRRKALKLSSRLAAEKKPRPVIPHFDVKYLSPPPPADAPLQVDYDNEMARLNAEVPLHLDETEQEWHAYRHPPMSALPRKPAHLLSTVCPEEVFWKGSLQQFTISAE